MKSYIVRRKGVGATSCPVIAEAAGINGVFNLNEEFPPADADVIVRWGTTTGSFSGRVINKSGAIETSSDKRAFRTKLQVEGLCPKTWNTVAEFTSEMYGTSFAPQKPVESVLIRPAVHSRSEGMFLCTGLSEVNKAIADISGAYYISEFVKKKHEYRVMVVQGKVVWVIEKHPKSEDDVTWGCVEEGSFEYVYWSEWPMEVVRNAIRATQLAGLDFGAVDIIVDSDGRALTLEVNTAPWLSPYYAKKIGLALKWMIEGKEVSSEEITTWQTAIHPSSL